ncbi:MAG: hypothetical protein DWP97_08060 [Calditrichaeota bacterium]|nr:MAG: hypothetical protein DWP97_08060 [Calditrichota bacterium]
MSIDAVTERTFSNVLKQFPEINRSEKVQVTFNRYPNGFLIARHTDASGFLKNSIRDKTKRDTLSILLAQTNIITRLGTKSFTISVPVNQLVKQEKIKAIKLVNESILLWTEENVYKIPASEKALQRVDTVIENIKLIHNLDNKFSDKFLIPQFLNEQSKVSFTPLCKQLTLNNDEINLLDSFLERYLNYSLQYAQCNQLVTGFQHGDMHYKNIFLKNSSELCITDLDMISEEGYPFIDLMHFTIHLIRTKERLSQHQPFETFLADKSYLFNKLLEYKFPKLAEIWIRYYSDDYIPIYIQNRLEWYKKNRVSGNEIESLQQIEQKYNADRP